jgi:hypothetical protein
MNLFMIFVILLKIGNLYSLEKKRILLNRKILFKKAITKLFFFFYQKVIQSKSSQSTNKLTIQIEWCTRNANKR